MIGITGSKVSVSDVSSVASQLDVDLSSTLNHKKLNLKLFGNIWRILSISQEILFENIPIVKTLPFVSFPIEIEIEIERHESVERQHKLQSAVPHNLS